MPTSNNLQSANAKVPSPISRPGLHFDVSTGLKRVLGRELITNDEVAIFEMVKNSFDAAARTVYLHFGEDSVVVADNGSGMTYKDLQDKWLFVAYSAKRDAASEDFRNRAAERNQFAGSKGIGRFSSDRLGESLVLQTRKVGDKSGPVHQLDVNWQRFEVNDKEHFESVPVVYSKLSTFDLPAELEEHRQALEYGTVIRISRLRTEWTRQRLLALKASLSKLINPFGSAIDEFSIVISAPAELAEDEEVNEAARERNAEAFSKDLVNGRVGNFIFSELQRKTTFIHFEISKNKLHTVLTDRGELIYEIEEPNPYGLLKDARFSCEIYYLNQSAKVTFTKRVGLPSVQFGSLFLFRNGFRVYPIGNDGDDWFGFDRRKAQGYNRFLGAREIIGRVDVFGEGEEFQEASSRDAGLIETPAAKELRKAVSDHGLKRLEKYVVPVSWKDKLDAQTEDLSRLKTDPGRNRVSAVVANLVDNEDVRLISYNRDLVSLVNERSEDFEASLESIRSIAEKTQDKKFLKQVDAAEKRFAELRLSESRALRIADEERAASYAAQERADAAEAAQENEKRRASFLESAVDVEVATILNLQHQVTIYAVDMGQQIENLLASSRTRQSVETPTLLKAMEQIAFLNRKILAVTRFASRATFQLDSENIKADLPGFIEGYIRSVVQSTAGGRLKVSVHNEHPGFTTRFNPIDVSIIVDNLVSNARRAKATEVAFTIRHVKNHIHITAVDNGTGLTRGVDPERMFEMGYSTTDGSGLGLYHVRQVLGGMSGSIVLDRAHAGRGAAFTILIAEKK